jgi:hypothetical protein
VHEIDGQWFADSPMGRVGVVMAPENAFGVLDHDVLLPDGTRAHNAFRVVPAGTGCVFSFVLLRTAGASRESFEADAAHVLRDLEALKRILEGGRLIPLVVLRTDQWGVGSGFDRGTTWVKVSRTTWARIARTQS